MKCPKCGERIKKTYKLCPNCGEKIEIKEQNTTKYRYKLLLVIPIILFIIVAIVAHKFIFNKIDVEELKSSVVQIHVFDENKDMIATGSGVVAFNNNIVLTNAHVVENNYNLEVISENNTKYAIDGIIAYDKKKDISILKLKNSKKLKSTKLNTNANIGDDVVAIGSPLGLKNTVSNGNLSAYFQDDIEVYQHTAPISPGSSGGALFNKKGELIGITYASIEGGQNINLAIPIKYYKNIYIKVKDNYPIATKQYKYLNNGIIKTKYGSQLMNYALNDKYGNDRFKSGPSDEAKDKKGYLETCKSLDNCINVSEDNYKKIGAYVDSSLYLFSGVHAMIGTIDETGKFSSKGAYEGSGYTVVLLKKNKDNFNDNELKKFLTNEFDDSENKIEITNNYVYYFSCENYDKCNEVKQIINQLVK